MHDKGMSCQSEDRKNKIIQQRNGRVSNKIQSEWLQGRVSKIVEGQMIS